MKNGLVHIWCNLAQQGKSVICFQTLEPQTLQQKTTLFTYFVLGRLWWVSLWKLIMIYGTTFDCTQKLFVETETYSCATGWKKRCMIRLLEIFLRWSKPSVYNLSAKESLYSHNMNNAELRRMSVRYRTLSAPYYLRYVNQGESQPRPHSRICHVKNTCALWHAKVGRCMHLPHMAQYWKALTCGLS